jgi:phage gp29-like protein
MTPASRPSAITDSRIEQAIRQRFSPFPELTMEILTAQLNSFRIGELRAMSRTWEVMMERDGELMANATKRFKDAARIPWEIMTDDDSPEADRHKEALVYFFNQLRATSVLEQDESGGMELLIRQLMTAQAYRYSVHEILWRVDNAGKKQVSAEFRHCPVWFFESRRGRLGFLRDEFQPHGELLKPGEWLVGVGDGLMRPCAIAYLIKHLPLRDWLLYSYRFGLPAIHGETSATKGSQEWDDFEEALNAWINGLIIQTNLGAKVTLIEAGKQANAPFEPLVNMTNQLYAKLFRGSDLATGAQKEAVGASLQLSELNIFVADDCGWAAAQINERVVRPVIGNLFGTAPKAWLKLLPPKADTTDRDLKTAEFCRDSGVPISINTVRERFTWPEPAEGDALITAPAPAPARPGGDLPGEDPADALANAADHLAFSRALAADLQPFLTAVDERLQRILEIEDPYLRKARWDALWSEMEGLRKDIQADPAAALQLERMMAAGFSKGLSPRRDTNGH